MKVSTEQLISTIDEVEIKLEVAEIELELILQKHVWILLGEKTLRADLEVALERVQCARSQALREHARWFFKGLTGEFIKEWCGSPDDESTNTYVPYGHLQREKNK